MPDAKTIDYTKYDIKKGLLKLSLPAMGSSVFTALYDLGDMFWIGKLGTSSIAGVTVAMSLYWFGSMFNDLFGSPSVILLSRRYGEKDYDGMQKVFSQTILLKLTFAIVFMFIAFSFRRPLLVLLGSTGDALEEAIRFFSARIFFMPIAFASYTINTALRSTGDVNRFAVLQTFASIFNIVLDPILIFKADLGVAGAAIATGCADLLVLSVGLYWLTKGNSRVQLSLFKDLKPDMPLIKTMFRLGGPTIVESGSNHIIGLLVIRILNSFGVVVVAAWGILNRARTILFMVSFALEMAVATMVGQNLGAGFKERARKTAYAGIKVDMLLVGIYSVISFIFAHWFIWFFDKNPEVIALGSTFLRVMAIGDFFFAGYMACLGALSGAGETKKNMVISLISNWTVLMPLLALFTFILKVPPTWLPVAYGVNNIVLFILSFSVIKKGDWLHREL